MAACSVIEKLPVIVGLCRATNTQTHAMCELNRKQDGLIRKLDTILVKLDRA